VLHPYYELKKGMSTELTDNAGLEKVYIKLI